MNFHTDVTTFYPCGEDQTAAWSEHSNYEQAALAFDWATADPIASQNPGWVFPGTFDDLPDVNVELGPSGDLEAAGAGLFIPGPNQSFNIQDNYNHRNADLVAPSLMPTPALTDSDTIASPPADASWDGHTITPTQLMSEPQSGPFACAPAAADTPSPAEWAWSFEQLGHFQSLAPSYTDGSGGVVGSYSPDFNFSSTIGYTPWGSAQVTAPPLGVADANQSISPVVYMPTSTRTTLGKRPRGEEETRSDLQDNSIGGPPKRAKRKEKMNRVLEAGGSISRAHQMPMTRTLVKIKSKSEAVGRGAGKLVALDAHEVYSQSLPGPSVQQELVVTAAQGELPWIEGSAEEASWNYTDSIMWQQEAVNGANEGESEDEERRYFRIPRRLSQRQMGLLEATPDDLARGTVRELKCRLCPDAGFGNWEDYRRHCKYTEAHPIELSFCDYCGDFFAREDSLKRHRRNRPAMCKKATPNEAQAKRRATEQAHEEFEERLERYLETNEEIGEPFAQRVKAMHPNSVKRGSRQQNRLKRAQA